MAESLVDKFEKVKQSWAKKSKEFANGALDRKSIFELAYHSANQIPYRCIEINMRPGDDEAGNYAVLFSSLDKIFIELEGKNDFVEITVYAEDEGAIDNKLNEIETRLTENLKRFDTRSDDLKKQITLSILVERKIDETINLVTLKDITRKVYLAIGDTRERGALIPLIMKAPKADVVQLAIMKWWNMIAKDPQDQPFPEKKVKGLIKNFLQIKEWLVKRIEQGLTDSEENLFKEQSSEVVE
ncbi:MAG: putative selenocysteine system protein [Promethearchaeota archaeon]